MRLGKYSSSARRCEIDLAQARNLLVELLSSRVVESIIFRLEDTISVSKWSGYPASGPGIPQAVRVWTGKTVWFGSRPLQQPNPELLGVPNPYPYLSTCRFCPVCLDPSVPVSGSPFRVFLFMVAVPHFTVMCKILTLVHHSLYWFHWQPLYSKQGVTCSLLHPEVECDQVFILHHL